MIFLKVWIFFRDVGDIRIGDWLYVRFQGAEEERRGCHPSFFCPQKWKEKQVKGPGNEESLRVGFLDV